MTSEKIILERLKDFHNNIKTTGKIDKHSVIALEEFIGSNVVTSVFNVNKLSDTPRNMGVDEVSGIVETKIKEVEDLVKKEEEPSAAEITQVIKDTLSYTLTNIDACIRIFYFNNKEGNVGESLREKVIEAFNNETIKYRYVDGVLTDLTKIPFSEIYGKYKDYITDVKRVFNGVVENNNNEALEAVEEPTDISVPINIALALSKGKEVYGSDLTEFLHYCTSALNDYTPKPITPEDICYLISSDVYPKLIKILDNVRKVLYGLVNPNSILNSYEKEIVWRMFKKFDINDKSYTLIRVCLLHMFFSN